MGDGIAAWTNGAIRRRSEKTCRRGRGMHPGDAVRDRAKKFRKRLVHSFAAFLSSGAGQPRVHHGQVCPKEWTSGAAAGVRCALSNIYRTAIARAPIGARRRGKSKADIYIRTTRPRLGSQPRHIHHPFPRNPPHPSRHTQTELRDRNHFLPNVRPKKIQSDCPITTCWKWAPRPMPSLGRCLGRCRSGSGYFAGARLADEGIVGGRALP